MAGFAAEKSVCQFVTAFKLSFFLSGRQSQYRDSFMPVTVCTHISVSGNNAHDTVVLFQQANSHHPNPSTSSYGSG